MIIFNFINISNISLNHIQIYNCLVISYFINYSNSGRKTSKKFISYALST